VLTSTEWPAIRAAPKLVVQMDRDSSRGPKYLQLMLIRRSPLDRGCRRNRLALRSGRERGS
jgi:hypothetical protein